MTAVVFIDTSVLCNLLEVPGRNQDRDVVLDDYRRRSTARNQFVLPIATVIETGNFIAQLKDGRVRRDVASRFHKTLIMVALGKSPWVLHDIAWNAAFLQNLLRGCDSGADYVELTMQGLGAGDLCILTERHSFQTRSRLPTEIWTLDTGLRSYS